MSNKYEMYKDVFSGNTDYIPLIVKVNSNKPRISQWDTSYDPQLAIDTFLDSNSGTMQVDSDWIPNLESNFIQSLIGSMWGADTMEAVDGSLDILPCIDSSYDGANISIDTNNKDMIYAREHLSYISDNIPTGVTATMTRFLSPLDVAVVLRGGEFYLELLTEPKDAMDFLMRITEVTIDTALEFKKMLNDPNDYCVTNRGIYYPGIRLSGDSIVNLSPKLIKQYMYPVFERVGEVFGSVMLHYCCTPAPSGHVLPSLLDCRGIKAVDNWQGYDTFFDHKKTAYLQDRIAIMTDLDSEIVANPTKLLKENDLFSKVNRKGGRAIVVTTSVDDIDSGQRLYENWRNTFS